jgi:type I restriction enzyme S subunit
MISSRYPLASMGSFLRLRKEFFVIDDVEEYQLVTVQLHARGIKERNRVVGADIKTKRQQRIKAGDLLVAEIDAKVGGYGIVPDEYAGAIVSSHYFLYEIDRDIVEPQFLEYYLKSGYPEDDVQQFVKGSVNYAAIRSQHFPQLEIPLPPLGEQQRIVARIEALTGKVNEAIAMLSAAIHETEAVVASESNSIFSQTTATSPTLPIGKVFTYRNELIRPRDGSHGPIRFVGLQHVEPHTGRCIGEDWLIAEELKGRKFKFSPGEILYGYLRPYLNKVWVADRDGICSVDQYVLRPKPDTVDTHYLAHFMRSPIFLKQAIEGTHSLQLPRLGTKLLEAIAIPLPVMTEQHRIVERLNHLQARVADLGQLQAGMQAKLEALLPSVLDRAFKGEL